LETSKFREIKHIFKNQFFCSKTELLKNLEENGEVAKIKNSQILSKKTVIKILRI